MQNLVNIYLTACLYHLESDSLDYTLDCYRFLGLLIGHFQLLKTVSSPSCRHEPVFCNRSNTIMTQFFNEYIMVMCIKSFFQSSKIPATHLLSSNWAWILFMTDMSTLFVKQFRWKPNCRLKQHVCSRNSFIGGLVFLLF